MYYLGGMLEIVYSKVLLKAVIRRLIDAMAILNKIDEEDYGRFVKACQKQAGCIKGIKDNAERGNIFMVLFFVRELIEAVLDADESTLQP